MKCTTCGYEIEENAEVCENCGRAQRKVAKPVSEKALAGFLGALLGMVLGCAAFLVLSSMGVYAPVGGLVLAFCVLLGYRLFGRKIGAFGGVLSALILLIVPAVIDWIDWALLWMRQAPEYDLLAAIKHVPNLLMDSSISINDYLINLGCVYGFVLIGVVVFIIVNAVIGLCGRKSTKRH